ncbi:methyltransferase family protein [Thermodesulfobacteriota bacterium]
MVKAIIILPGTVLVFVPAVILMITKDFALTQQLANPHQISFWLALLAASPGFILSFWTVKLFLNLGEGTPAPWDPPKKLVIHGPYCYVRNPMITGVLLILLAEALLFQSWPIALWMVVFFIGNAIYFPLFEEKRLGRKFGEEYLKYKDNVPRWIPRLKAWKQE